MNYPHNVTCTKDFTYDTVSTAYCTDDEYIKHWRILEGTKATVTDEDWRLCVTLESPIEDTTHYPYSSCLHRVFYKDIQSVLREWELDKEDDINNIIHLKDHKELALKYALELNNDRDEVSQSLDDDIKSALEELLRYGMTYNCVLGKEYIGDNVISEYHDSKRIPLYESIDDIIKSVFANMILLVTDISEHGMTVQDLIN